MKQYSIVAGLHGSCSNRNMVCFWWGTCTVKTVSALTGACERKSNFDGQAGYIVDTLRYIYWFWPGHIVETNISMFQ